MKFPKKIKQSFSRYLQEIVVILLAAVFFAATSGYLLMTQDFSNDIRKEPDFVKWGSPDETANYIFSKLYAQEGKVSLRENYNLQVDEIMHPRSFRSDHGLMKPVSFLGIILIYGKIASFFSYKIIPFLTPFFASVGLVFYYLLIRKIFGRDNAFWSACMLFSFPVYSYYSARSMFHNVLFIVLLVIGLYYSYLMVEQSVKIKKIKEIGEWKTVKPLLFSMLGGFFIGLAIMTRTSELLWILPALLLVWALNIRRVGFFKPLFFLASLFIALLPMFYYNHQLYGAYLSGGYPEMNSSIHTLGSASGDLLYSGFGSSFGMAKKSLQLIKSTIFHFGFDWNKSKLMFSYYFVRMFKWIFWAALSGMAFFLLRIQRGKRKQMHYLLAFLATSFILVVYYGSWDFHDNPDANAVTIGNSYTRYWLPIYLGALPFASLFLMKVTRIACLVLHGKFKDAEDDSEEILAENQLSLFPLKEQYKYCRNFLRLLPIIALAFVSVRFTLIGSEEGLLYTIAKSRASEAEWREVLKLTESNSAIVTRYHDKLFFPERKVIVGIFDDKNMNDRYSKLAQELPLYYYNFKYSKADIDYLNSRKLAQSNLHIEFVKQVTDDFSLYKLSSTAKK